MSNASGASDTVNSLHGATEDEAQGVLDMFRRLLECAAAAGCGRRAYHAEY